MCRKNFISAHPFFGALEWLRYKVLRMRVAGACCRKWLSPDTERFNKPDAMTFTSNGCGAVIFMQSNAIGWE